MSLWILLWFVLSAIILGASGWSAYILFRQKKAWEAFAVKHKMNYTAGRMMGPPTLEGFLGPYRISFFTAERQGPDIRSRRYVTVVEIVFPEGLIDGAAAGTPEMIPFMETLTTLSPLKIESDKWSEKNRMYARNRDAVRMYLNPQRLDNLIELLATRNADVIILFDDNEAMIRLETSDPILDPSKADKILKRLIGHADILRITKAERAEIKERAAPDRPDEAAPGLSPEPPPVAAEMTPDVPLPGEEGERDV